ncbi:hypothetical protein HDF16_001690 [Granulicella aggregans]|uniref:Uncharacterized protein n=1 Tax=Granulicella aggregans TaxID=474949 RepID=A0A7W8E4C6_9BACT|nr:hypothetical protein [Granulicella aggregans]
MRRSNATIITIFYSRDNGMADHVDLPRERAA